MIFGFALEKPSRKAGEPDRLLAERAARRHLRSARRIALVEQQVDHGGDRGEAFGALHGARSRTARRPGDTTLRPVMRCSMAASSPGRRGAILLDRETADMRSARDLLRRRKVGVAADEQQPQDVVAVVRAVEPVGQFVSASSRSGSAPRPAAGSCFFRRRVWSSGHCAQP